MSLRRNDVAAQCLPCIHMSVWSLDMGGNHYCTCRAMPLGLEKAKKAKCEMWESHYDGDLQNISDLDEAN